jgi:alkylhydroperoxidase family enzyme
VLDDWGSAPINEKFRATLGFVEKLTLAPGEVGSEDLAPARDAGVSDKAIEEAIHVVVVFSIIDRIADALGFHVPSPESFSRFANVLLKRGYK